MKTLMQRFCAKVKIGETPDDCWIWTGCLQSAGYGNIYANGKSTYAHRVSHEAFVGPIPRGLHIDHLCRVRSCVNPRHLRAVTPKENALCGESPRAHQARRTHCIHGHPLSGDNLYTPPRGGRQCKTCATARAMSPGRKRYVKEYLVANKERLLEKQRVYRAANRERVRDAQRVYRASKRAG